MNFDKEIALFHKEFASQEEALKTLADEFLKAGVVNDDFYEGIIEREKNYPTGLLMANGMAVAIPHTEIDKVKKSQIGFMSLDKPVKFYEMGQENSVLDVTMIFMLALKEAHEQLETLQNLVELFQKEDLMQELQSCQDKETYLDIIKRSGLE